MHTAGRQTDRQVCQALGGQIHRQVSRQEADRQTHWQSHKHPGFPFQRNADLRLKMHVPFRVAGQSARTRVSSHCPQPIYASSRSTTTFLLYAAQVHTSRVDNLGHHRTIQAHVAAAVARASRLASGMSPPPNSVSGSATPAATVATSTPCDTASTARASVLPPAAESGDVPQQTRQQQPFSITIAGAEAHTFRLPLAAALTTGSSSSGGSRNGVLLRLHWQTQAASGTVAAEISPLPGAPSSHLPWSISISATAVACIC